MPQSAERRREVYAKRKQAAIDDPAGAEAQKRMRMLEADRARKAAARPAAAMQLAYDTGSREEALKQTLEIRKRHVAQAKERRETAKTNLKKIQAASQAGDENAAASLAEFEKKKASAAEKRHVWRRNRRVRATHLYVYTALERVKVDFIAALNLSRESNPSMARFTAEGEYPSELKPSSDLDFLWNGLFAFRHKSETDGKEWYREAWAWYIAHRTGAATHRPTGATPQSIWIDTLHKLLQENIWRGTPLICKKKARQQWPELDDPSFPSFIKNLDEPIPRNPEGYSLNSNELEQLTSKQY